MGAISERLADLARRCGDLSPLREPVRAILIEGNKERALAGTDAQGAPFAPLAASTLKRRKGTGPPLAPQGAASAIVRGYVVNVTAGTGRLTFTGGWPGLDWVEYHHTGTPHMPARDPFGFRQLDLDKVRALLHAHITRR